MPRYTATEPGYSASPASMMPSQVATVASGNWGASSNSQAYVRTTRLIDMGMISSARASQRRRGDSRAMAKASG